MIEDVEKATDILVDFRTRPLGFAISPVDVHQQINATVTRIDDETLHNKGVYMGCYVIAVDGRNVVGWQTSKIHQQIKESTIPISIRFRRADGGENFTGGY